MLTDYKAEILSFIESQPNQSASISLLRDVLGPNAPSVAELMCSDNLLDRLYMGSGYRMQAKGRLLLSEYRMSAEHQHKQITAQNADQEAKRKAEEIRKRAQSDEDRKKQFKHDWRIAIFSNSASFITGLVVAHFFDIVGYCTSFLHAASDWIMSFFH